MGSAFASQGLVGPVRILYHAAPERRSRDARHEPRGHDDTAARPPCRADPLGPGGGTAGHGGALLGRYAGGHPRPTGSRPGRRGWQRGGAVVIRQGAGQEWSQRHIALRPFELHVEEAEE